MFVAHGIMFLGFFLCGVKFQRLSELASPDCLLTQIGTGKAGAS